MVAPPVAVSSGTQASQVVDIATLHIGETVPNSNWCANFVSQVYKEAGLSSVFKASGWVPTLVSQAAGKTTTNIMAAQPGDLIVFGNNEHVMIYAGNGHVIGTATSAATGVTKVVQTDMNSVFTA